MLHFYEMYEAEKVNIFFHTIIAWLPRHLSLG